MRPIRLPLTLLVCLLFGLVQAPGLLHSSGPNKLTVTSTGGATAITWEGSLTPRSDGTFDRTGLVELTLGSKLIPGQLVALRVHGEAPILPQIDQLVYEPWPMGSLPHLRSIDGTLAEVVPSELPEQPFQLLREARLHGTRIAVLRVTPLFVEHGLPQRLRQLTLTVADSEPLAHWSWDEAIKVQPAVTAVAPTNPAAALPAVKLLVKRAGLQRLTTADLAAVGIDLATIDPQQLRLRTQGHEVPLEVRGSGTDRELRFVADAPGDRWNQHDYYWLTLEAPPVQSWARMAQRSVATITTTPIRSSAIEIGHWYAGTRYDSTRSGPDGDHWFSAELKSGPEGVLTTATISITSHLPVATGPIALVLSGSTAGSTNQNPGLTLELGTATQQLRWSGSSDWNQQSNFDHYAPLLTLSAISQQQALALLLDRVEWKLPVTLKLDGRGASFSGVDGNWTYLFEDLPAEATLYDVTDPLLPVLLTGMTTSFTDGPTARRYLLAAADNLSTPELLAHTPVDLTTPLQATALYIAPTIFHDALLPLLAQRNSQGFSAQAISVQAIYDAWSYGQVDPEAIRSFIRYAVATWPTTPQAITLVGDGSVDPHDYMGSGQPTHIPPYLAPVDPWLGETACETCFVRLDEANPLDDPLPDLLIGRLPVKSVQELDQLVAKIVAYENAPIPLHWRAKLLLVADDPDGAGNFIAAADQAATLSPKGITLNRVFYDPTGMVPGGVRNAAEARTRLLQAWSEGAGLVLYNGHSSQQQWASNYYQSAEDGSISYLPLLRIYDQLGNGSQLPIVVAMSCLTGAFQTPYRSGMSLDEWLLLSTNQGAAAIWSSAGLGISYGHDRLQRGFLRALWSSPPMQARVGVLATAGYLELFTQGSCCQESLYHYLILGDPLMPARVLPLHGLWFPLISN